MRLQIGLTYDDVIAETIFHNLICGICAARNILPIASGRAELFQSHHTHTRFSLNRLCTQFNRHKYPRLTRTFYLHNFVNIIVPDHRCRLLWAVIPFRVFDIWYMRCVDSLRCNKTFLYIFLFPLICMPTDKDQRYNNQHKIMNAMYISASERQNEWSKCFGAIKCYRFYGQNELPVASPLYKNQFGIDRRSTNNIQNIMFQSSATHQFLATVCGWFAHSLTLLLSVCACEKIKIILQKCTPENTVMCSSTLTYFGQIIFACAYENVSLLVFLTNIWLHVNSQ